MQNKTYEYSKLHIIGILCLVTSLSLFFFSLYIVPYLIWQLHYNTPDFIMNMISYGEDELFYSPTTSRLLVWLIFFIPCLITGYASYYISNYIDEKKLHLEKKSEEQSKQELSSQSTGSARDSAMLGFKIILLMVLIIAAIFLLQTLINVTA